MENPSPKNSNTAANIRVCGRVQGVGFRFYAEEKARVFGLTGWVRNLPNGDVECDVEGPRPAIEQFLEALKQGPPLSQVDRLGVEWHPCVGRYPSFEIRL